MRTDRYTGAGEAQPREVALYAKAFQELSKLAVYGKRARELIAHALIGLRSTK